MRLRTLTLLALLGGCGSSGGDDDPSTSTGVDGTSTGPSCETRPGFKNCECVAFVYCIPGLYCDDDLRCSEDGPKPGEEGAMKEEYMLLYQFLPDDCTNLPEVVFRVYRDGEVIFASDPDDACPVFGWSNSTTYKPGETFEVRFFKADAPADDALTSACWRDADDKCGPIPNYILDRGAYFGVTNDGLYAFGVDAR